MRDFAALGLLVRTIERKNYGTDAYEVRKEIRFISDYRLVAYFTTTVRISGGEQILSTHTDFIQSNDLTIVQIRAVVEWLREEAMRAPWRLTSYTHPVLGAAA